jgi:hypothetical protein
MEVLHSVQRSKANVIAAGRTISAIAAKAKLPPRDSMRIQSGMEAISQVWYIHPFAYIDILACSPTGE